MDALARLLANPPDLPVGSVLPALASALADPGVAVVTAPPGSGKTTLVPPLLAGLAPSGRVVVTQPRRVAARAGARRLAHLLEEPMGESVGYTVRGERTTAKRTRVEFVTTGVLLTRLQREPDLPGVSAVVLDEVHERTLESDLVQAMLLEVRATLREDLPVAIMSATLDAKALAQLWRDGTAKTVPVVAADGGLHPTRQVWAPPNRPLMRIDERGATREVLSHVVATTRAAFAETTGDVLVFVPGAREIDAVMLGLRGVGAEVLPLHGRLAPAAQDLALTPSRARRIIVSTAVAESSLTVPGVRTVVDSGLARRSATDQRRGLAGLVTVNVSRASADQRAGRAGREGPGTVYRCWSQTDHARLAPFDQPEILTADLTSFVLHAACWSPAGASGLALLESPPAPAVDAALTTLRALGALDEHDAVTPRGRRLAEVPADPRLARALLDGARNVGVRAAAEVVAMLAEDVPAPGGDLAAALRSLRRGGPGAVEWGRTRDRLVRLAGGAAADDDGAAPFPVDAQIAHVVALAYPDRIARRRTDSTSYLMAGGSGAVLPPGNALTGSEWLVVAVAAGSRGRDALIRSAVPIDEAAALEAGAALVTEDVEIALRGRRVVAHQVERIGAIALTARRLDRVPPEGSVALREALAAAGIGFLRWSEHGRALRSRMSFLHRALGAPWPDVGDDALTERVGEWLPADITDLGRIDTTTLLRGLLPWPAAARLDELAPERLTLPSGRIVRVDYDGDVPVIASRLQDFFGLSQTPRIAGGAVAVQVHLLSPAGRPAAITSDLAGFWSGGYQAVRSDLRGRYPKHAWPQVPPGAPNGS